MPNRPIAPVCATFGIIAGSGAPRSCTCISELEQGTPGRIDRRATAAILSASVCSRCRHPQLPGLALSIALTPDPIAVGETATISITIENRAPYPAEDLVVTAPTPDGALALPGPNTVSPTQGWRWSVGHLDGSGRLSVTGSLRLARAPQGDALALTADATARGLQSSTHATGGALVVDRSLGPATTIFTPGSPAILRSRNGRVTVQVPARILARRLTLRHGDTPLAGFAIPPDLAGLRRTLGVFFLDAMDDQGVSVHQFTQPLTITVGYTPEQLSARGIDQSDLALSWFDSSQERWIPLAAHVDSTTHTVTAQVDHFTPFALTDASSSSALYTPSLQGFQTDLFTGAASYNIPIDVPAGPGGLKPSIALNYSSAASNGSTGVRIKWQAGWVGKGWNLSAEGFVARNRSLVGNEWDYFTLVFGGRSFDVVRGQLTNTAGCTNYADKDSLQCWTWQAIDENFARVRAISLGTTTYTPLSGSPIVIRRFTWQAWTKDGLRYDFTQPLLDQPDPSVGAPVPEEYKWLLKSVTDTHGNVIQYDYQIDSVVADSDYTPQVVVNPTYYLQEIKWGYDVLNPGNAPRYKVSFIPSSDPVTHVVKRWVSDAFGDTTGVDCQFEYPGSESGGNGYWVQVTPHEMYRLNQITVSSMVTTTYQFVRGYNLYYKSTTNSVESDIRNGQKVLTLDRVQQVGKNSGTLPAISFTYYPGHGDNFTPIAGENRLKTIDNGQGGKITFAYDVIWTITSFTQYSGHTAGDDYNLYENYHRVHEVGRTANTGLGTTKTYSTTYTYTLPAINDQKHAATVFYAYYPSSGNGDSHQFLARPEKREFRGHASVEELAYDGVPGIEPLLRKVKHWFYQGNSGVNGEPDLICTPPTTSGAVDDTSPCFKYMVRYEAFKGKEYQTTTYRNTTDANPLQQTTNTFNRIELPFFGSDAVTAPLSNNYRRAGLWRAFNYISRTVEIDQEAGMTMRTRTTDSFYNSGCTTSPLDTYGNLGCTKEYDGATLLRRTTREYVTNEGVLNGSDWGPYIVDRMWQQTVYDGSGNIRALTNQFYDNSPPGNLNNVANTIGNKGDLTRVAQYFNVPLLPNLTNQTVSGTDATFSYDAYGNRITETSYANAGTRTDTSGALSWSAPGTGSTARTTMTTYDSTFHVFPTQQDPPSVGGVTLTQKAGYDFHMGTMIQVTGPNGTSATGFCAQLSGTTTIGDETSCAQYDEFGRMVALIKPGDSAAFPTVQASYDDFAYQNNGQPFRYLVQQREVSGQAGIRPIQHFYDGLGREIQVKRESAEGAQNIVVDSIYDGLDRVAQQSQARSVNETPATTFWSYTPPGGSLSNPTTTSYDALGRPIDVVLPDLTHTTTQFTIGAIGLIATTTDAKGHKADRETDLFGRLRRVLEYSGNGGSEGGYATYATTTYAYDPLDRLTTVTDAQSSVTSISYDSLGRKTQMTDPDMGTWNYLYDANGNLTRQTDARGQRICLYYDALDRLAGKHYRTDDACPATFPAGASDASYSYDQGTNGKGQRTAMSLAGASTSWLYDARGRSTKATYTVPGLSGTRVFDWTYDSADRVQTLTYPAVGANPREVLTYAYDSAWRPTSACTSFGGCYATTSQPYTALDQPKQWTFGNGLLQTWTYNSPMARLQQLQVGTVATPGSLFSRSYTYDNVGNVATISDPQLPETQNFGYDHRDRLTRACTTGASCTSPLGGMLQPGGAMATTPSMRTTRVPGLAALLPIAEANTADISALITPPDTSASAPAQPDAAPASLQQPAAPQAPAPSANAFGRLPLAFVPNQGQTAAAVRFLARSGGGTLFFTPDEAVLNLPSQSEALTATALLTSTVVRLRYLGAAPNPELRASDRLPGVVHYLRGSDPTLWKTNVPTYNGIVYAGLYEGIDLRYEGSDGRLKSTYHVAAGGDPTRIRWRYIGATDVQVDASNGNLLIQVPVPGRGSRSGQLREEAPSAWQDIDGQRVPVSVRFAVGLDRSVHFVLGTYNPAHPLVIDPVLSYSTYLGGTSTDKGQSITVDAQGQAYIAGSALSTNFPTTSGAYQGGRAGDDDVFISKLSPDGTQLLYSTYLGGSDADEGYGIALDSAGNIAITGHTQSSDFPTTSSGVDTSFGGTTDAFVTSLTANGSALRYSTYLGGSSDDQGWDIAVPSDGRLYVVGTTLGGLPSALASYDTTYNTGSGDAFVSVIDPTLSGSASLRYSTYLGGTLTDRGAAIVVDSNGYALVTGRTASTNFPVVNAYQSTKASNQDVFVAQLDPNVNGSSSLRYSTYLGGSSDEEGSGIAVTSSGVAVVVGFTTSNNFPTLTPYQATRQGDKEGFLTRINPAQSGAASLVASTYLGGSDAERDLDVVVDSSGLFVLSGYTRSANFPLVAALQSSLGGGTCGTGTPYPCGDALVMRFDSIANAPLFSSYLGGNDDDEGRGVAVDASGAIYVTGFTFSPNFPTANPQQSALNGTATDAFIAKINPGSGAPTPYDETYSYDSVGNLTLKGPTGNGKSYTYGAQSASCAPGALSKPHAVINDGVTAYCYDQNGNMLSGGNRSYAWDAESRPSSITSGGVSESYSYDADGERIKRAVGSTTTVYLGGLWEEVVGGTVKSYYTLNGTVVAVRDSGANVVTYLHGDHLGSVSLATTASGQGTPQYFGPWGARRAGGIGQTNRNYTGQYLDGTGLLYYHARYYDPVLARFVSPDTLIPGVAPSIGGGGGALGRDPRSALRALTVDFHEPGFAVALSGENRGSDGKRSHHGPTDPQTLNRYSYVLNDPLLYVDPSGHQAVLEFARVALLVAVAVVAVLTAQAVKQAAQNPPSMAGEPASPPQPTPPLPAGQQIIRDTLLDEHPGLHPDVATAAARGGASAAGPGGKGADVVLLNGGGREVSVHSGAFTSEAIGGHLVKEAGQAGTTEIYFQINSAGASRGGLLQMMSGLRNGYRELAGTAVKIFGPEGEVWWSGTFRGP